MRDHKDQVIEYVCPQCGDVTEADEIVTVFADGTRATYCTCGCPSAYWVPKSREAETEQQ